MNSRGLALVMVSTCSYTETWNLTIESSASKQGWGASYQERNTGGGGLQQFKARKLFGNESRLGL